MKKNGDKGFKIRKARSKDLRDMAKILVEESSKKPYNEKYTLTKAIKEVREFLKKEAYVAIDKKELVGFIASSITSDDPQKAYINELWLKIHYQGKGIGTALVKAIEEIYKKKKVKTLRLVTKRNADAFKFYKKIKYKEHKELVYLEKKLK